MKRNDQLLNSIFEVSHDEFQTFDLTQNKLVFSSGMASRMLGYPEQQYAALSKGFYKEIIHPDDVAMVQKKITELISAKQGEVIEMTARFRKSDGDYSWLYSRNMLFERNAKENKVVIVRQVQDVTQLVELEQQLKEKVKQLHVISYQNSHLLRSPVASIIGLVDMIEDSAITSDHNRQVVRYLKETVARLDQVIREINLNADQG